MHTHTSTQLITQLWVDFNNSETQKKKKTKKKKETQFPALWSYLHVWANGEHWNKHTFKHAIVYLVKSTDKLSGMIQAVCVESWEACNHWRTAGEKKEAIGQTDKMEGGKVKTWEEWEKEKLQYEVKKKVWGGWIERVNTGHLSRERSKKMRWPSLEILACVSSLHNVAYSNASHQLSQLNFLPVTIWPQMGSWHYSDMDVSSNLPQAISPKDLNHYFTHWW